MQQPVFELDGKDITFTHLNVREEKHGEETVPAVDLEMSISTENDALALFHSTLRSSLYDKPDVAGADLADKANAHLPIRLRYPNLAPLKWDREQVNCKVTFHYGLDGRNDIVLDDAKVNKFRIEPHDGGTVDISWRVQSTVTHEQIGRLAERLSTKVVSVSIEKLADPEPQTILDNKPVGNPLDARDEDEDDDEEDRTPAARGRGRRRASSVSVE